MISNLVFDFGGVLFPIQPYLSKVDITPVKFRQIKQLVIDIYDDQQMSFDYLQEKILYSKHVPFTSQELEQIYKSLTVIDLKLFEMIKQLSTVCPLYALVNEAPKWTNIRRQLFNLDDYFKHIFVSSEIGLQKPDIQSYKYLIEKTGIGPSNSLFIDDEKVNVDAAISCGMSGFEYKDCNQLKNYLSKKQLF